MAEFITKIYEMPIASDRAKADIAGNSIVDTYATKAEGAKVSVKEGTAQGYLNDVLVGGTDISLTEANGVLTASSIYGRSISLKDFAAERPILFRKRKNTEPTLCSFYIHHNKIWLATMDGLIVTEDTTNVNFYVLPLNTTLGSALEDYMFKPIRCARVWNSETDWDLVIYALKSTAYNRTCIGHTDLPIRTGTTVFTTAHDTNNLDLTSAYKVDYLPIKWINASNTSIYLIGPTEADSTTSDTADLNPEQGSTELS
jgi:hypothetical protein